MATFSSRRVQAAWPLASQGRRPVHRSGRTGRSTSPGRRSPPHRAIQRATPPGWKTGQGAGKPPPRARLDAGGAIPLLRRGGLGLERPQNRGMSPTMPGRLADFRPSSRQTQRPVIGATPARNEGAGCDHDRRSPRRLRGRESSADLPTPRDAFRLGARHAASPTPNLSRLAPQPRAERIEHAALRGRDAIPPVRNR